jgi:histone-lysine N-methyltransferase SETMAR
MEWRKEEEPGPVRAKSRLSAGKVMATVFFDLCGLLHIDFLHKCRTINAAYYCEIRQAYRRKRRDLSMGEVVLLQDNARPHTAALTQLKLEQLGWKTLEHPPYSPDLSPATFMSLVPSMKLWEVKGSTMMLGLKPMCAIGCRHDRLHSTRTGYQSYLFAGKNVF